MKRATFAVLFLLAAPAAGAWVPCEQKDITPPRPIQREAPAYPQAVRELGIEGSVEVALTVLRDGSVGWVRIVRAEPRGYFEQAAAEGVRRWRFSPAMQDGQPSSAACVRACASRSPIRLRREASTGGDRPQPVYPPALLQARIEGYAEVEYDLDPAAPSRMRGSPPRCRAASSKRLRLRPCAAGTGPQCSGAAPRNATLRLPAPRYQSRDVPRPCSRAHPSRWPPASGK